MESTCGSRTRRQTLSCIGHRWTSEFTLPVGPSSVDVALEYRLLENRCATFMYMDTTVGIADLRQNLSLYLRRVENGERLLVTDRNRPVAELGPPPSTGRALDRLIAEGRVTRPIRRGLPAPLQMGGDPYALSRALDEIRGEL